jgi:hypothetical protein
MPPENESNERLVKAFDAGDRSVDLLAQIHLAAWEAFHDPWERKPDTIPRIATPSEDGTPTSMDGEDLKRMVDPPDARILIPISLERIGEALLPLLSSVRFKNDRYLWEQLEFKAQGFQVSFQFRLDHARDPTLLIQSACMRPIPGSSFQKATLLCNCFNLGACALKASLSMWDSEDPKLGLGRLTTEFRLALLVDIHQALLKDVIRRGISEARAFWSTVAKEKELWT